MTFGLRNAAQSFQRLIHEVVRDLNFVFAYMDDLIIASPNEHEHKEHIRKVFTKLQQHNLSINLPKCQFGQDVITFLGHTITATGIAPNPEKVESIRNFPLPKTVSELKTYIAMINFYRKFIPNAVQAQIPLLQFLKGNKKKDRTEIVWTDETRQAFEKCKTQLIEATLLNHPKPNAGIFLSVDASNTAIGAALHQLIEEVPEPLGFFSKKFTEAQKKYSTYDRELAAIYQAVKYFRHQIEGRIFYILTDHKPLV